MVQVFFAVEEAHEASSGIGALGISPAAFVIQLISFVIVFLLLKRFAFKPIINLLEERRTTIDAGVRNGQRMEKAKAKLEADIAAAMRDARTEADKIIARGHKEAREVIRDAEKAAQHKADVILADAEVRQKEEAEHARRSLEKEIVGLVSEATEAVVEEKVDTAKDKELIRKAVKGRNK